MSGLFIEGTKDSPTIRMKTENHHFTVEGRSFPEDSFSYYEKVLDWINQHPKEFSAGVTVTFFLTYVNSTSAIMLSRMLHRMKELAGSNPVKVVWKFYADDESLEELGYKLSETSSMTFEFEPVDED